MALMDMLALGGGALSGLLGANASKEASEDMKDVARWQLQFASDIHKAQNRIGGQMYRENRRDITRGRRDVMGEANRAQQRGVQQAGNLRDLGNREAAAARNANTRIFTNAQNQSLADVRNTRDVTVQDANRTYNRGLGRAVTARDQALNAATYARDSGLGVADGTLRNQLAEYGAARDASLGYFQPALDTGNNALAAYAYNLGLGSKPNGYRGLEATAGTNYLLNEGRKSVEGGAAGAGGLYSGNTMQALEEMRHGLVAQDYDMQMAQMFGLVGVGQNAAGNMAGIQSDFAGKMGGARDNYADRAINLTGQFADRSTNATDRYAQRGLALDADRLGAVTDARNLATGSSNALRGAYGDRLAGVNDTAFQRLYGVAGDYATNATNATERGTDRRIGAIDTATANLGNARANRSGMFANSANNFLTSGTNALQDYGTASAAGTIGGYNALMGGLANGVSLWGAMGGQLPGMGGAQQGQQGQMAPLKGGWWQSLY